MRGGSSAGSWGSPALNAVFCTPHRLSSTLSLPGSRRIAGTRSGRRGTRLTSSWTHGRLGTELEQGGPRLAPTLNLIDRDAEIISPSLTSRFGLGAFQVPFRAHPRSLIASEAGSRAP